ncbi:solute carrier family 22 member 7 [Plodia interpunctella]|uniref:solute carrier family 22 member 7 n=1 Tax=Plodia interpunctella TaxID=58824 RepID=UPI002367E740|nr:solute carrier family 22 member 7 [Plodia interpunctella]
MTVSILLTSRTYVFHKISTKMNSIYDRALYEVGPNGTFQKKFDWFYNFLFAAFWGMTYMNIFLALVVIPHRCEIPKNTENISEISWKSKYIPTSNDTSGKIIFSSCEMFIKPGEKYLTKACDNYHYDQTWYETTVPSSFNWVCEDELKVAHIMTYSKSSEIAGSLFFGWFGDIFGRRLTYIISLALIIFGRAISIASSSFILFVAGCVIAWFPSWSVVQSATVISMEISSPERRSTTATLRCIGNSVGMCIMSLLYWWLRDWKSFMIVTTLPTLPFLMISWKMIESPRWLWIQGRSKECIKELKVIAEINKLKLDSDTEKEILNIGSIRSLPAQQQLGPLALFSGWRLATNTLLQLYLWVSVSLNYSMLIMRSGEKSDGNPFSEFAWQSLAEMPGTFVGAWLADRIGRRYTGSVSYTLMTFLWMIIALREISTNDWIQSGFVGTAMVVINRLATSSSYYIIYLFNMELYPTCLRQSGMSLGNVLSSGGGAIAPYLMYLGRNIDSRVPCVILVGVSVVGVIASLLLPETLNAKLPETLKDAQEFGNKKNRRSHII